MKTNMDKLKKIIVSKLPNERIRRELSHYHDSDIADVLQSATLNDRLRIYQIVGYEKTADIFAYYDDVEKYIDELDKELAADILEQMDSNEAIDVLDELEDESRDEIINLMEQEAKEEVQKLDAYDEDVIGSYGSDNFIVIYKNQTIKQAMSSMVKEAGDHDNIYTLYVVDEGNHFFGAVSLRDLIVARKDDELLDLCKTSFPFFYDDELMSDCINRLKEYGEPSIPILNHNNELISVITSDSIIDATEEELGDDYAKLGGLTESEALDESTFHSIKIRIPWLIILLFLGLIVSSVIGSFEEVIAALPVVVFFQSIILDMAGNVGTQSLAVTIRNITDEKMSKKQILKNIMKEIRVGFINGLLLAMISFVFVLAFLAIKHQEVIPGDGFMMTDVLKISGIISMSLLIAMTISSFIGTAFPLLLNKMHIDPAVASGPFITTMNDVVAVLIYYGLAYLAFLLLI